MSDSVENQSETTVASPPDWDAVTHESIPCPMCEYNLRGLREPRCPECGFRFKWDEVLDPRRQKHPYLYEHHPERDVWSFRKTILGAWRPRRFWSELHPAQPSRLRRLFIYWLITVGLFVPAASAPLVAEVACGALLSYRQRAFEKKWLMDGPKWQRQQIIRQYGSLVNYLDTRWPAPAFWPTFSQNIQALPSSRYWKRLAPIVILLPICWPWLTLAGLLIFQISMRRARIKTIHVLRAALYSFELLPLAILLPIYSFMMVVTFLQPIRALSVLPNLALAAGMLIGLWRLRAAYKWYLRFDHPGWTALSSQIIAFLLAGNLLWLFFPAAHWVFLNSLIQILP